MSIALRVLPSRLELKRRDGSATLAPRANVSFTTFVYASPVQAYIAAMPAGWKRDVGRRLDALIVRTVPSVRKAVKWNTPFYGIEGRGWFLGFHVLTQYVKVAFFRGTSLQPLPPVASKVKGTRYLEIHEGDDLDETQIATWVKQAVALPGWIP